MSFDLSPRTSLMAATAAAGVAVLTALTLSAFSRPADLDRRLAVVDGQITRAERLALSPSDGASYPAGAVCASVGPGADALKRRVETRAAAASAALTALAVDPGTNVAVGEGALVPIRLKLEASGKYEAMVGLLQGLAAERPTIFVDTADLKPQSGGAARLQLSGRVLCWPSDAR
jgi:hypothetical protein